MFKPEQDAFGQALMHYQNGKSRQYTVERDDGHIDHLKTGTYFQVHEEWPTYEREAMKSIKGRVLDVGCGAGRHAIYLQNTGFDVLGIDASPLAIEICKRRGLKNAKVMPIEEINYGSGSFDTVLMMGNNFGLFGSVEKARVLLERIYRMTTNDAVLIASSNDVYKTSDPVHLMYQETNRKRGRMSGQIRLRVRFMQYTTPWYDYLMVSKEEMEGILIGTGWQVQEIIESEGSNYVAIIHKKSGACAP